MRDTVTLELKEVRLGPRNATSDFGDGGLERDFAIWKTFFRERDGASNFAFNFSISSMPRWVLRELQPVSMKVDDSDHTLWLTARQCRLNKPERDLASSQAKLNKMKDFVKVKRKMYHLYSVNLQNGNNRKRSKMKSGKLQQQFLLPRWNSSPLALIIVLSSTLLSSVMVKGKPICLFILFSHSFFGWGRHLSKYWRQRSLIAGIVL